MEKKILSRHFPELFFKSLALLPLLHFWMSELKPCFNGRSSDRPPLKNFCGDKKVDDLDALSSAEKTWKINSPTGNILVPHGLLIWPKKDHI